LDLFFVAGEERGHTALPRKGILEKGGVGPFLLGEVIVLLLFIIKKDSFEVLL